MWKGVNAIITECCARRHHPGAAGAKGQNNCTLRLPQISPILRKTKRRERFENEDLSMMMDKYSSYMAPNRLDRYRPASMNVSTGNPIQDEETRRVKSTEAIANCHIISCVQPREKNKYGIFR